VTPLLLLFVMMGVEGQADPQADHHQKSLLGAGLGFTFIPLASDLLETDARGLFVPTIGLDYFLRVAPRWEVGFLGAYELDYYVITDGQLERDNAVMLTLVGMFNITNYLGLFTGGGVELEQHTNLGVFRLGIQYTIDIREHWALVPKMHLDVKKNFNTWSFAVTFARKL
jgi:hypothetical protein